MKSTMLRTALTNRFDDTSVPAAEWKHFAGKESRENNMLEPVLVTTVEQPLAASVRGKKKKAPAGL